jgi:KDO2-lipid IV(A) lauroyltransferase
MKLLVYSLYYILIVPLSKLPFSVLYKLSDGLYLLTFYVLKYRKEVVWMNLKNSFPEKSDAELEAIRKQFYHNFCDLIVENIKFFSITADEAMERCTFSNPEVINDLYEKYPLAFAFTGHLGNWEMAGISTGIFVKFWPVVSYKPFNNVAFEKLMTEIRSRFFNIVPYYEVKKNVEHTIATGLFPINKRDPSRKPVLIFLPDQAPSQKNSFHWVTFLNQETAFYTKVEDMARTYNVPVVFCNIARLGRGNFRIDLTLIAEQPAQTQPLEITNKYIELLEKCIRETPHNWLWSHKRWKRKRIV